MKVAIFGATGALGGECLEQALEAGHEARVLVRDASKLPAELHDRIEIFQGNALVQADVERVLGGGTEAVLFAIGVDKESPEDLCTDATRLILEAMRRHEIRRFVWCGGGSTLVPEDAVTFGARFVELFGKLFLGLRHRDKQHQLELLAAVHDIEWVGIRPLQMTAGPKREKYRLGFNAFSGMSKIHFADCAHAMIGMLEGSQWIRRAPIIQY